MRRRRLLWRVFGSIFLITLLCLTAAFLAGWSSVHAFVVEEHFRRLERTAVSVANHLAPIFEQQDRTHEIATIAGDFAEIANQRCTIIAADGTVLFDNRAASERMDDHEDRPEIHRAMRGQIARERRHSFTLGQEHIYVAVPITLDGRVAAVVRIAESTSDIESGLTRVRDRFVFLYGVLVFAGAAGAFLYARSVARPIETLRHGAERFGKGELTRRIPSQNAYELSELADALNQMAAQLERRIDEITRQRNERQAMFDSMQEGVIALDSSDHIIGINSAAGNLLGVAAASAHGKLVQEVIRNVDLQRFIADAQSTGHAPGEEGISQLRGSNGALLEAKAAPLCDGDGRSIGLLVILGDVTRIRKLENLRKEFVANVSHELKTPVTSIKGYAETLIEGALDDPESARHMVEIIGRQADRLRDIIEDLLRLSRLDRSEPIERSDWPLHELLSQSVENCNRFAREKNLAVELNCPADLKVFASATLLSQAISNLIENAIKYGNGDNRVTVSAEAHETEIRICVADRGAGIEAEHLPRLFERFYRVDKARSRELGGTGLGLSIVKHVAQAHGGRVTVESEIGKGSQFCIILPRSGKE